eukprot:6771637-Lingulodinium_polyedra.AAC.1
MLGVCHGAWCLSKSRGRGGVIASGASPARRDTRARGHKTGCEGSPMPGHAQPSNARGGPHRRDKPSL